MSSIRSSSRPLGNSDRISPLIVPSQNQIRDSLYEAKYKERPRSSLSALSFFKPGNKISKIQTSEQKGVIPDVRKDNMKILLRFLSWQDYPEPVSLNTLQNPTKIFLINLWNFMLRKIDNQIDININNANDEVPRIYKELGYPLTVSKSSMLTPGVGMQWSQHLAALCWLSELLIYEAETFPSISDGKDMPLLETFQQISGVGSSMISQLSLFNTVGGGSSSGISIPDKSSVPIFFRCLSNIASKTYLSYISGKENSEIKNTVLSQLEIDVEKIKGIVEKKEGEYKLLQEKCLQLKGYIKEYEQAGERMYTLDDESRKMTNKTVELKKEIKILEENIKSRKEDILQQKNMLNTEKEMVLSLEEKIKNQIISKEEAILINKEISKNREAVLSETEQVESLRKECTNAQAEKNELSQTLLTLIPIVNRKFNDCKNLSHQSKSESAVTYNKIKNFDVNLNSENSDGMLGVDWKEKKLNIINANNLDEDYIQKLNLEDPLARKDSILKDTKILQDRAEMLRKQERSRKNYLITLDAEKSKELKDIQEKISKINEELDQEQNNIQSQYELDQERLNNLQQQTVTQVQRHLNECRSKWKKIASVAAELGSMKQEVLEHFARLTITKKNDLARLEKIVSSEEASKAQE